MIWRVVLMIQLYTATLRYLEYLPYRPTVSQVGIRQRYRHSSTAASQPSTLHITASYSMIHDCKQQKKLSSRIDQYLFFQV